MSWLFDMGPDGEPGKDDARSILTGCHAGLCESWFAAWADWKNEASARLRGRVSNRSRAGCINDLAVEASKELLAGVAEVEFDADLGFHKLYVADKIVLRFKRLDKDYLALVGQSDQQQDFYLGRPIEGLRNHCLRLNVGYVLDPSEDHISDVLITRQFGRDKLLWSYSIFDDAEETRVIEPVARVGGPPNIRFGSRDDIAREGS
ncbi:MAG: hypothetical protein JNK76_26880 [Planctomycetales bacterium]|nr:hypothetical protein [Planctomycetales bacterium]